jgi:predicted DNA-binding transcriptional regulator AlpA
MPVVQTELFTRPQAAAYLNLSETTLRRWYAASTGPRVCKLGTGRASRVRYPKAELDAFIRDPVGYAAQTRPEGVPHFEPPSRGNPRQQKVAKK